MLDIKQVRRDPAAVASSLARRGFDFDVARFESLDAARKQGDTDSQALQAARNKASKQIGQLIGGGMTPDEAKAQVADELTRIDAQIDDARVAARDAQQALDQFMLGVPNLPDETVPDGLEEADNAEISRWGEPVGVDEEWPDHVDIGAALGGMDFEAAAKITGSRFVVLSGTLARLHRALTQFMLNLHITEHGYDEVYVPYIVNADSLQGTSQLPKFEEDLFKLEGDHPYYLAPTAEVPVTNLLRDRVVEADEIAAGLKFVAHTPCFRSEAGSYGRDTRGMIRQHQFEKVELVQAVHPDNGEAALEALTGHAEAVLQQLQLPYRKMLLCAGDMGFAAHKTFDLEVWLPGQQAYREISSCSYFGDFQARRMLARYRDSETGKPAWLHTLNGSGLAVGRTLVAVLENYWQPDGSLRVPEVLQPLMGCEVIGAG